MTIAYTFILAGVILALFFLATNQKRKDALAFGYHSVGKVLSYESKFVRIGGTWTWLDYPIVEYVDKKGETKNGYIKYAKSSGRYFSIGQNVDIIIYDDVIYYKGALHSNIEFYIAIALIAIGLILLVYKNVS